VISDEGFDDESDDLRYFFPRYLNENEIKSLSGDSFVGLNVKIDLYVHNYLRCMSSLASRRSPLICYNYSPLNYICRQDKAPDSEGCLFRLRNHVVNLIVS
jgi:hypothetical protein